MTPLTLTTERLVLRPFRPGDAEALYTACQEPDIARWTTLPWPYERQHAESFVSTVSPNGWRDETLLNFGSFTRDTGALVSSVGLVRLSQLHTAGIAEIGYWTAREHRGRGYTVEAVTAVARWAFTALGVQRLEWVAESGNVKSRAVAERAGFTIEGTLRSRIVHGGTRRDAWLGALLPGDIGLPEPDPYLPYQREPAIRQRDSAAYPDSVGKAGLLGYAEPTAAWDAPLPGDADSPGLTG